MGSMLERMRAAQKQKQAKNTGLDPAVYPFWNMDFGKTVITRLLPFDDPITQGYWTELKYIPTTFLDPADNSKTITFDIPCLEMYDSEVKCPVLNVVRDVFKEQKDAAKRGASTEANQLEAVAKKHWLKPRFYYQGFVLKSPFIEETPPENPIRIFPVMKQLHLKLYNSVFNNDADPFSKLPTGEFTEDTIKAYLAGEITADDDLAAFADSLSGYNFNIMKIEKGGYANYESSAWHRESSDLTDEQIEAIGKFGLHNLREKLPQQPTEAQYEVMVEIVKASIAGEDWNPEWEAVGIKPRSSREEEATGGENNEGSTKTTTSGSSTSSRIRENLTKGTGTTATSSSKSKEDNARSVIDRLKRKASTPVEAPVSEPDPEPEQGTDEPVEETAQEPEPTPAPAAKPVASPKATIDMIKAKLKAKA